mmetsp:Transcript_41729/g.84258  ORF Transcript_41729/g.84258 Transcript_41729/m.84258 type:complete len:210 (-) Transcript_41729:407-1036(-)
MELGLHLLGDAWQEGRRVVPDDPEVVVERLLARLLVLLSQLHQREVVSGHGGVARGVGLLQHVLVEDAHAVLPGERDELRLAEKGHQQILHKSSDVEHGHRVDEDVVSAYQIRSGVALTAYRHASVRDRDNLRLLGGAGSVEHQADVVPLHGSKRILQLLALQGLPDCVLLQEEEADNVRGRCDLQDDGELLLPRLRHSGASGHSLLLG